MNKEFDKVIAYVDAASDLAEAVQVDIKTKARKVSDDTVLKLSKFIVAANALQPLLDQVESTKVKLN